MKSRLLALCMVFVLLATLVPGVMAQDKLICGDLSAEDCTALTSAFTNTANSGSGALTLDVAFEIQSEDPTQAMKAGVTADGKFSGVSAVSMDDMSAMTADPAATVTKFIAALKGFSGELNLTATLPASSAAMLGGEPVTLNLLLVDGVGYIDFSKLPAMLTSGAGPNAMPQGWAGLDLIDVLTNLAPSLTANMSGTSSAVTSTLPQFQALLEKYLQYTRDGNNFIGYVDVAGLLMDADFQKLANASSLNPTNDAQKAAIESLKEVTFQLVFTLDEDKISEIQVNLEIPTSTIAAFAAAGSSGSTAKVPTGVSFSLDLNYSGLGEAQTIAAPEGAPVTKFAELMAKVNEIYANIAKGLSQK